MMLFKPLLNLSILLGVCTQSFPWRSIWEQKVPSKVAFFVWIAVLGTILTIDNLHKKKVLILDLFCMCKSNGELVDHLLLHCPIVFELWSMVFTLFGIYWAMPKIVVELLACWQGNLVTIVMVLSRWLSLIVWCGAFGWRETTSFLKILKGPT